MTDSLSAHLFDDAHFDEKAFVERIAASSGSAKPSKGPASIPLCLPFSPP